MNALFYAWVALNLLVPALCGPELVRVCEINSFRHILGKNAKTTGESIGKAVAMLSYPGVAVAHTLFGPPESECK